MNLQTQLETKTTIARRMKVFQPYLAHIDEYGFHKDLIQPLISDHASIRTDIELLQKRYEVSTEGVPILERPLMVSQSENERVRNLSRLVNNKVNTAFDCEIIDEKVGYTFGIPINYNVDSTEEEKLEDLKDLVEKFRVRNNVADKDSTLGKQTDIAGYGARLAYTAVVDGQLVVKIANVEPQECIFFYDDSINEPKYAVRYYNTYRIDENANKQSVTVVEFYDNNITRFYDNFEGDYVFREEKIHGFDYCPLFGIENNDEMQGAAVRIMNLIDAYDRSLSDANNEVESMRLAMLVLRNVGLNEEDGQQMQKSGYMELWGDDSEVSYLTKNVNDGMIEHHLDRLHENIMHVAKSVDFAGDKMAANTSYIALKLRTMPLENKAIIAEQKMRSALQYQFKVICSMWAKLGLCRADDYMRIFFDFKRNLPDNILEEAQIQQLLKGFVSENTRLGLFSKVDDVEFERRELERDSQFDLLSENPYKVDVV